MILDANDLDTGSTLTGDVCIVGAGAAGITIARELIGSGLDVVLLEGGGLESSVDSQALYEGELTGRPFGNDQVDLNLANTRLRYFGGTTNHWAGFCRPFEELDFTRRDWLEVSGWPIELAALQPYYDRAAVVLELLDTSFDPLLWQRDYGVGASPVSDQLVPVTYQIQGQRFGPRYQNELRDSDNVRVVLHANVTNVAVDVESDLVTAVDVRTLAGNELRAECRAVVLAMGGVENARLLLASNDVRRDGIGNNTDLVGRHFTEHVQAAAGFAVLAGTPTEANRAFRRDTFDSGAQPVTHALALSLAPELVTSAELVGAEAQFYATNFPESVPPQAVGVAAPQAAGLMAAVESSAPQTILSISVTAEQALDPNSRITLLGETDALGVPRVSLDWRQSDIERTTMVRLVQALGEDLGRTGLGRAQLTIGDLTNNPDAVAGELLSAKLVTPDPTNDDTFHVGPGNHHMCTTRMAATANEGVVDADCRVFGTANLFVAGSSVFATGGVAPPTFTITALAIRLADILKATLR
jgi:choline dehydrogenase-like flavoprotein